MTFRWEWFLVPLACVLMAWVLSVIQPACAFNDVTNMLHVQDRSSYAMLACLGCAIVAFLCVARIVRRNDGDE